MKGRAITVASALAIAGGLIGCEKPAATTPPMQPAQTALPGRYQVFMNPGVREDTFLVDTQEGRIWKQVVYTDLEDQPVAWDEQTILDSSGKTAGGVTFSDFRRMYPPIKAAKPSK